MKPSWDTAPERANYLAMADGGEWRWHEMKPIYNGYCWLSGGKFIYAGQDSPEERPKK